MKMYKMPSKCYVNCEVGLDGDGEPSIFRIKNVTPDPIYKIYEIDNLPSNNIAYGETINISIKTVYFEHILKK